MPDSTSTDNSSYSAGLFKLVLLSVRSLTNKTFIINVFLISHRLDCILLIKTWLDETGSNALFEASPLNFSSLHCFWENKKDGSVASIFSDNLSGRNILLGNYFTLEY